MEEAGERRRLRTEKKYIQIRKKLKFDSNLQRGDITILCSNVFVNRLESQPDNTEHFNETSDLFRSEHHVFL